VQSVCSPLKVVSVGPYVVCDMLFLFKDLIEVELF
jgi:hypothetical protein